MKENDRQRLIDSGIDYADGVERFLGEVELYDRLLVDFLADNTFEEAEKCAKMGDSDGLMRAVHAMKSVTGTLSMNGLYRLCSDAVEALRRGDDEAAGEIYEVAYRAYLRIADCIRSVLADGSGVYAEFDKI